MGYDNLDHPRDQYITQALSKITLVNLYQATILQPVETGVGIFVTGIDYLVIIIKAIFWSSR
jgi:hypothetical protein